MGVRELPSQVWDLVSRMAAKIGVVLVSPWIRRITLSERFK
ncbi:hypothetical protein PI125_g23805 [Phytophthora idaei]|nr:hypothetical protein PI125_g23805 [Phytophthora idaei]